MNIKKIVIIRSLCLFLVVSGAMAVTAGEENQNISGEINWINGNLSVYGLPKSFQVPEKNAQKIWKGTINAQERIILNEGMSIYDAATAQILWAVENYLEETDNLTNVLWTAKLGVYDDLTASASSFSYGAEADILPEQGKRGYRFKIINAEGNYSVIDPLNGQVVTWQQWQPISGENAWAGLIGSLQTYDKKYGNTYNPESIELKLAKEIARPAMFLQTDNGGIRMAPTNTYHPQGNDFLYYEISTENSLSWYAAFRMLNEINDNEAYQQTMAGIEGYLQDIYIPEENIFAQGRHYYLDEGWTQNDIFATDCQTWAVLALGAEKIDTWFGEGTTYLMWQKTKELAGNFDRENNLLGLDFTDYRSLGRIPMIWVEGTAGAILACRAASQYYNETHPEWAEVLGSDEQSMYDHIQTMKIVEEGKIGYPYASGSGPSETRPTGHGWYAPTEEVLSLASTCWVALVKLNFNPFILGYNHPPILNPIGNKEVLEGELLEFTVTAADSDADALSYTADNLPEGAVFNEETGLFRWTPDYNQAGVYENICFKVSDGKADDSENISITVYSNSSNQPPTAAIVYISPNPAVLGTTIKFSGYGYDPDGRIKAYSWHSSINGFLSSRSAFRTKKLSAGEHIIYLKVKDNKGTWSAEVSETLTVNPGSNKSPR